MAHVPFVAGLRLTARVDDPDTAAIPMSECVTMWQWNRERPVESRRVQKLLLPRASIGIVS